MDFKERIQDCYREESIEARSQCLDDVDQDIKTELGTQMWDGEGVFIAQSLHQIGKTIDDIESIDYDAGPMSLNVKGLDKNLWVKQTSKKDIIEHYRASIIGNATGENTVQPINANIDPDNDLAFLMTTDAGKRIPGELHPPTEIADTVLFETIYHGRDRYSNYGEDGPHLRHYDFDSGLYLEHRNSTGVKKPFQTAFKCGGWDKGNCKDNEWLQNVRKAVKERVKTAKKHNTFYDKVDEYSQEEGAMERLNQLERAVEGDRDALRDMFM